MPPVPPLVLFAAALLRIPARRIRALGAGDDAALRDWLANESIERLADARRDARVAFAKLEALGGRVVTLDDPDYPAGLRELSDPPPFLTVRGTLPGRSRWREGTAIVGTRKPTDAALAAARELAAVAPGPIVSGLARGIDGAAHEGALLAGTPTLAYDGLSSGASRTRRAHRRRRRRVAERGVAGRADYQMVARAAGPSASGPRRRDRSGAERGGRRSDARARRGATFRPAALRVRAARNGIVRRKRAGARGRRAPVTLGDAAGRRIANSSRNRSMRITRDGHGSF